MTAIPHCLTIVALALALMALPPPSLAGAVEPEVPLPSALAEDDECLAGDERCSLNALQLRGKTMEAGSAHATMQSTLQGLFSDLGRMVEGAEETCQKAAQALTGCMPNIAGIPTFGDVKQMCSCSDLFEATLNCPAPYNQGQNKIVMKGMCSDCGLASAEVGLNPKCTVEGPTAGVNPKLDSAAACGSQCHPLFCGMIKACPVDFTVDLPAAPFEEGIAGDFEAGIAKTRASAKEMVKSCACSE